MTTRKQQVTNRRGNVMNPRKIEVTGRSYAKRVPVAVDSQYVHEVIDDTKRNTARYTATDIRFAVVSTYAAIMTVAALAVVAWCVWG